MAFIVPVMKKDYQLYATPSKNKRDSAARKQLEHRRRVMSLSTPIDRRLVGVKTTSDQGLSRSAPTEKRHVRFSDCQEIHYRQSSDEEEEDEEEEDSGKSNDDLTEERHMNDKELNDENDDDSSVDSGRSSIETSTSSHTGSKEDCDRPPSILRRSDNHWQLASNTSRPHSRSNVRAMLNFLVTKCAPKN